MDTTLNAPVDSTTGNYAGFWIRFVAYVIDAIVLCAVNFIIVIPILGVMGVSTYGSMSGGEMTEGQIQNLMAMLSGAGMVLQLVLVVIGLLYFVLMESSARQGTLGKMVLGLKVVGKQGERINFGQAFLRYIGKIISAMIFMIGYIMAAFTDKKRALHDMIAGTYVMKK